MTWKTGTLKVNAANATFRGYATFKKHSLGYYEAVLNTGEKLQHQHCTELGTKVLQRCIQLRLQSSAIAD